MSCGIQDVFCIVVSFLDNNWAPHHVTILVFQVDSTNEERLAPIVEKLLTKFNLMDKENIPFT